MLAISLKPQCAEMAIPIELGLAAFYLIWTISDTTFNNQQMQFISFVYIEINIAGMHYI